MECRNGHAFFSDIFLLVVSLAKTYVTLLLLDYFSKVDPFWKTNEFFLQLIQKLRQGYIVQKGKEGVFSNNCYFFPKKDLDNPVRGTKKLTI